MVPTDDPESDGTLEWDSTTIVVVEPTAAGRPDSATPTPTSATAKLIESKLAGIVRGARRAGCARRAGHAMGRAVRNLGRPGVGSMAISAVDIALWDLKARLLGLPLARCSGWRASACPSTAAAASPRTPTARLPEQLAGWVARGHTAGEDEGRPRPRRRCRARAAAPARRSAPTRSSSSTPTAPTRASRRSRWPSASAASTA